jgi:hypothetical protein
MAVMPAQDVQLSISDFPPLAVGFFGLGTGYLIYFSQELLGWPPRGERVNASTGVWGIWMPGFMQLLTGTYLFVGLAWFHTFRATSRFTWRHSRLRRTACTGSRSVSIAREASTPDPNAGMAVAFTMISALGIVVFFKASDWPVGLLFIGLTLIYVSDTFASTIGPLPETVNKMGERASGFGTSSPVFG